MAKAVGRVCKSPEGETMRIESMQPATALRKEGGRIAIPTDTIADKMSGLRDITRGAVFRLKYNSPS